MSLRAGTFILSISYFYSGVYAVCPEIKLEDIGTLNSFFEKMEKEFLYTDFYHWRLTFSGIRIVKAHIENKVPFKGISSKADVGSQKIKCRYNFQFEDQSPTYLTLWRPNLGHKIIEDIGHKIKMREDEITKTITHFDTGLNLPQIQEEIKNMKLNKETYIIGIKSEFDISDDEDVSDDSDDDEEMDNYVPYLEGDAYAEQLYLQRLHALEKQEEFLTNQIQELRLSQSDINQIKLFIQSEYPTLSREEIITVIDETGLFIPINDDLRGLFSDSLPILSQNIL